MQSARFLVLAGDGINCEKETANAFLQVGLRADIVHINDLLLNPKTLLSYQGFALPGGFSFGDELGSGQILALKLRHGLSQEFLKFKEEKWPILGICNGMQVLIKLGALPFGQMHQEHLAMGANESGHFQNSWADLHIEENTRCHWIQWKKSEFKKWQEGKALRLPIRHGEGQVVALDPELENKLTEEGLVALRYQKNVNGSLGLIAGLTDPSGSILGLMPHPEAATSMALWPLREKASQNPLDAGPGILFFESVKQYLKER